MDQETNEFLLLSPSKCDFQYIAFRPGQGTKHTLLFDCRPDRPGAPLAFVGSEKDLVLVAQEILRHFRPTPEDKILMFC